MKNEQLITGFIDAVIPDGPANLERIYDTAVAEGIPVIRRDTQSFLKTLLQIQKPKTILEAGTAVGFSSVLMAQYTDDDTRIITIENYKKRIGQARENFKMCGFAEKITLIEGDVKDVLKELKGPFDLVFMDAAKGQYIHYLADVKKLMRKGSILLSDNVFADGNLAVSRFLVERRDRTIHERMREYIFALMSDEDLQTSILKAGDGLALSVMK